MTHITADVMPTLGMFWTSERNQTLCRERVSEWRGEGYRACLAFRPWS